MREKGRERERERESERERERERERFNGTRDKERDRESGPELSTHLSLTSLSVEPPSCQKMAEIMMEKSKEDPI